MGIGRYLKASTLVLVRLQGVHGGPLRSSAGGFLASGSDGMMDGAGFGREGPMAMAWGTGNAGSLLQQNSAVPPPSGMPALPATWDPTFAAPPPGFGPMPVQAAWAPQPPPWAGGPAAPPQAYRPTLRGIAATDGFNVETANRIMLTQQHTMEQVVQLHEQARLTELAMKDLQRQREQYRQAVEAGVGHNEMPSALVQNSGQLMSLLQVNNPAMPLLMAFPMRLGNGTNSSTSDVFSWDRYKEYYSSSEFRIAAISACVWTCLIFLIACVYHRNKAHPPEFKAGDHTLVDGHWKFDLLQCLADPWLCIFACCCSSIRWSDTMRMAFIFRYWVAFILLTIVSVACELGVAPCGLLMLSLMVYGRQKIRYMFDISPCTCFSIAGDCCTYCFCSPCALVQEAQQMEAAWQIAHPALRGRQPLN